MCRQANRLTTDLIQGDLSMQVHVGGIIVAAIGAYALLGALGMVPLSKDPDANERWREKFGTIIKIASPVVILYGLGVTVGLFQ